MNVDGVNEHVSLKIYYLFAQIYNLFYDICNNEFSALLL